MALKFVLSMEQKNGVAMLLKRIRFLLGTFVFVFLFLSSVSCQKNFGQEVLYNRARNLHDRGHLDKAITIYQRILETDGDHSEVIYDLGVAYADKGDIMNAKKQAEILKSSGRIDLAQVLEEIIRDANSARTRKKLQGQHQSSKNN